MGAGVMHSRSIEFAKKYSVPLMVRNSATSEPGTWVVAEEPWMAEVAVCGAALAVNEARILLEALPDRPGVSHALFSALAGANIPVDMIAQNVGQGGRASIGFTVINSDLSKTTETLAPLVAEMGAKLTVTERVSKVSVVGAGMRHVSGVAERMFRALADAGINMKMITTGDIKISVLIDEDLPPLEDDDDGEVKVAHREARRAVRGRLALEAVHDAFGLHLPRQGAGLPAGQYVPRPAPRVSAAAGERQLALARLNGMEAILVSGVLLSTDQSRVTVADLPDRPGNCSTVFSAVAAGGILVDTIVQNLTAPGRAELTFTVPTTELERAIELAAAAARAIDPGCRVTGDSDIAILYVLGVGMRTHTGVARAMFGALAARDINIVMINTSEVCLGVVIARRHGTAALECLREAFALS